MENPSYIGLSRQIVLERQMAVVANNLANMNTTGFKAETPLFVEYLNGPDRIGPRRGTEVSMVLDQGTVRDLREGTMEVTNNPLDVALRGEGYLMVETFAGPRYFRGGRLTVNAEGLLVNNAGLPVIGTGDVTIIVPDNAGALTIGRDGFITSENAGEVGQLRVVRFENENQLSAIGGGLYVTNQQPADAEDTQVVQGMLESSNVQPIVEMTRMIAVSRSYEATQNFIQNEHERQRTAIQQLIRAQA